MASNVDVTGLMAAIARQPELWNANTLRTSHDLSPHKEAEDIWIRFDDLELFRKTGAITDILDSAESVWYPAADALPQLRPILFALMRQVEGVRLGRVMVTKLAPGKRIYPHADEGAQANYYARHHIVLQGLPGSLFRSGDETVNMQTGEIWWFNNHIEHEVLNNSFDDRIHVIADIKC